MACRRLATAGHRDPPARSGRRIVTSCATSWAGSRPASQWWRRARETPMGMTANSFTSVSLEPPLILVCVNRQAAIHQTVLDRGSFAVSVLSARQEHMARYFANHSRPRGDKRIRLHRLVTCAQHRSTCPAWRARLGRMRPRGRLLRRRPLDLPRLGAGQWTGFRSRCTALLQGRLSPPGAWPGLTAMTSHLWETS